MHGFEKTQGRVNKKGKSTSFFSQTTNSILIINYTTFQSIEIDIEDNLIIKFICNENSGGFDFPPKRFSIITQLY